MVTNLFFAPYIHKKSNETEPYFYSAHNMDPWFESLVSGCFYSQTRLRTKSECSEELIWSFPDSSAAFNDTSFLSHTGWERYCSTHYRKDLSQNSPWSKAVLRTKFHRSTFRETKSPVPNSYSFSKNAFNIAEEPLFILSQISCHSQSGFL